ncbi:MAG: hypothetical protein KDK64_05030 [Chlamydiia bacterium]|nr:hypothetical protein [Chlamydiia bacterium]
MAKKFCILVLFIFMLKVFAQEEKVITPPAGPFVKGGADVFITGEFLWWKGIQEGLRYATSGVLVQPNTTLTSSGKAHSVHYPWEPGFRVGIGFYPKHDGWDLYGRYTWYHSSSTDRAQSADGNMVPISIAIFGITNASVDGVTTARSHWDLHYNIVDLELGRNFFLSQFLATRLFFGLRGTWTDQEWKTRYTSNRITFGAGNPLPGTITTNQDQETWGVGIRMGLNGTWTFFKGFSIVSDASFSGVWIDYDVKRQDQISQDSGGSANTTRIKSTPDTIIANIELMLGLRGEWWFQQERYHLAAQLGWEAQVWINYGHFIYFTSQSNGDLSFSGLTAKLRFDF